MPSEATFLAKPAPENPVASRWYSPRVIVASSVLFAMTAPAQTASISVFVDPLIRGLHSSRSAVSAAYLIGTLAGAGALPLFGRANDRYGARRMMAVIGLALGLALLALAAINGVVGLVIGFTGLRMLGQGALALTVTIGVAVYIDHRRGLAQGIVSAVGSAGILLTPIMLEPLIAADGFRATWLIEAFAVWVIVIPVSLAGLPCNPKSLQNPHRHPDVAVRHNNPADWTRRQAIRTGTFWVIASGVGVVSLLSNALMFNQISLLGERGLTPAQAAAIFIPQTAAALSAPVAIGYLADKVPDRALIIVSLAIMTVALVSAGYIIPGWSAIGYGIALGMASNSFRTLEATAFPNCFGTTYIGGIRSLVHIANVVGSAFGPILLSLGYAWAGSYRPVVLAMTVLPLTVLIFAIFTKNPPRIPPGIKPVDSL